jgi:nucleolar protein 6
MVEVTEKLTKKQRKALEFKNKAKGKEPEPEEKKRKRDEPEDETTPVTSVGEPKKKRKTRRGKKGKGSSSGPRFLLFVGNLPYDVSETELLAHFSASKPDRIRIRTEKGIAFLEFDGDGGDIQHRMDVALRLHHSSLRRRKINVELTVGGGGNSKNRLEKIKDKNEKLDGERKDRVKKTKEDAKKKEQEGEETKDLGNVHPLRAAMIRQ